MALSVNTVPVVVRSLLASRGADVSNLRNNRIIASITPALSVLAYRVARGPDYRGLQKEFAGLSPANGWLERGNMGDGLIFDLARSVVYETNSRTLLVPIDSLQTLRYADLPTGQIYYAQDGPDLRFREANGTLDSYFADVTIRANYIPTLSDIPQEYHGLFFDTLAEMLTVQPAMRTQELAEVGRA